MITESRTEEVQTNSLRELTRACSENGIPLIIDMSCLTPKEDKEIYNPTNSFEKRREATRAFGEEGHNLMLALEDHLNNTIYFPRSAHSLITSATRALAGLIRYNESHKSVIKSVYGQEKRVGWRDRDEMFKELTREARLALRPWVKLRKKVSNRTIPDELKPEHIDAYAEARDKLGNDLLDILYERGIAKDHMVQRFEQIILGTIALGNVDGRTAKLVTYNSLAPMVLVGLYKKERPDYNLPKVEATLLRKKEPSRHFSFPLEENLELLMPWD